MVELHRLADVDHHQLPLVHEDVILGQVSVHQASHVVKLAHDEHHLCARRDKATAWVRVEQRQVVGLEAAK